MVPFQSWARQKSCYSFSFLIIPAFENRIVSLLLTFTPFVLHSQDWQAHRCCRFYHCESSIWKQLFSTVAHGASLCCPSPPSMLNFLPPQSVFWFTSLCVVHSTGASGESLPEWHFINANFKASPCFLRLPWKLTGHGVLVGNNFSVGFSFAPVTFWFLVLPLVSLKSLCFCPALLSENLCDSPWETLQMAGKKSGWHRNEVGRPGGGGTPL